MPDDFDLFPDRKNLDPFAFGKKDEGAAKPAGEQPPDLSPPDSAPPAPSASTLFEEAPAPRKETAPVADLSSLEEDPFAQIPKGGGKGKGGGAGPSRLVLIGGGVVLLLGLAWAGQTFVLPMLKKAPPSPAPVAAVPQPVAKTAAPALPAVAGTAAMPAAASTGGKPAPAATPAAKPAAPVASPKPVEKPAPPAPKPVVASGGGGFFVQVGAAAVKANVDAIAAQVKEAGYQPVYKEGALRGGGGGEVKVVAGPFRSRDEAERAGARINGAGLPAILTAAPGGSFSLRVGKSYPSAAAAEGTLAKVKGLGIPVKAEGDGGSGGVQVTQVRVGPFATEAEAVAVKEELKGKGFDPYLVRPGK